MNTTTYTDSQIEGHIHAFEKDISDMPGKYLTGRLKTAVEMLRQCFDSLQAERKQSRYDVDGHSHGWDDAMAHVAAERKAAIQPQESRIPELVQLFLQSEAEYGSEMAERGILFSPELSCEHALRIVLSAIQPQHVNGDGGDVLGELLSFLKHARDIPWQTMHLYAIEKIEKILSSEPAQAPVRSVSDADVDAACRAFYGERWLRMDQESPMSWMRAALEAFLKGGEGHE